MNHIIWQYIGYFICGMLGLAISTILILRSLAKKAQAAKLIFDPLDYFKLDWYTPAASLLTIILGLFLVDVTLKWNPGLLNWMKLFFAALGYLGSDVAARIFSAMSNRLDAAISSKANDADRMNGTEGTLTPAAKPDSSPKN